MTALKSNSNTVWFNFQTYIYTGENPGFQVRGAHLEKLRRAKGGANIFGVFRVKNYLALSVPDDGCSRKAPCALNLIYTLLLHK